MSTSKSVTRALVASGLVMGGLAVLPGSAEAEHEPPPGCLVITEDTTLDSDVGPCDTHGIVIAADDVTLDLNGYSVLGDNVEMEQAGVLFAGVRGSSVIDGQVTGFDAGVAIEGGGGNTVDGLIVEDNVNDMIEAVDPRLIIIDPATGPTPEQMMQIGQVSCSYGDGITTFDSSDNIISDNLVVGNGPYSGISLVGDSNRNTVGRNRVHDNDLLNNGVVDENGDPVFVGGSGLPNAGFHVPAGTEGAVQPQSMCGATDIGTPGMGRGRQVQSIGIRVEGPGADRNIVDTNTVTKGGLAGISFHSYVLIPAGPNVPVGSPNRLNIVRNNKVSLTGVDTSAIDSFADGIASLASGPTGTVTRPSDSNTIVGNQSFDNVRHGISLGRLSFNNTVDRNRVLNNGGSGVWVAGPVAPNPTDPSFDFQGAHDNLLQRNFGRGNVGLDGVDNNPECDNNVWRSNDFRTFNLPCVAGGRAGATPLAAAAASAADAGGASDGGLSHSRG